MDSFLNFLEAHYVGLFLTAFIFFSGALLINWVAWIFSWGRFKGSLSKEDPGGGIFFLFTDLMVKIINDFRHFLALILVLIFAISLGYAFYISDSVESLSGALQAVVSTLGGLIGSIVGYYFGESAARRATKDKEEIKNTNPIVEQDIPEIKDVPPPQNL